MFHYLKKSFIHKEKVSKVKKGMSLGLRRSIKAKKKTQFLVEENFSSNFYFSSQVEIHKLNKIN